MPSTWTADVGTVSTSSAPATVIRTCRRRAVVELARRSGRGPGRPCRRARRWSTCRGRRCCETVPVSCGVRARRGDRARLADLNDVDLVSGTRRGDRVAVGAEDRDDRGGRRRRRRSRPARARPPRPCPRSGWSASRTAACSARARRSPRPGRSRPGRPRSSPPRRPSSCRRPTGRCVLVDGVVAASTGSTRRTACSATGCSASVGVVVDGCRRRWTTTARSPSAARCTASSSAGASVRSACCCGVGRGLGVERAGQRGLAVGERLRDGGRVGRPPGRSASVGDRPGPSGRPGRPASAGSVGSAGRPRRRRTRDVRRTTARNAAHDACDAVTLAPLAVSASAATWYWSRSACCACCTSATAWATAGSVWSPPCWESSPDGRRRAGLRRRGRRAPRGVGRVRGGRTSPTSRSRVRRRLRVEVVAELLLRRRRGRPAPCRRRPAATRCRASRACRRRRPPARR